MENFDNIIGKENIFLYPLEKGVEKMGGGGEGIVKGEISSFFLFGLFILAIITFIFIYFIYEASTKDGLESGKIENKMQNIKKWITDKIDAFISFIHVEGETIKKVIAA
jgi:high-affinity nickel permease